MKSTIKIALGASNNPVIECRVVNSDDIRDQLCFQFFTSLGNFPGLCHVDYQHSAGEGQPISSDILTITPVRTIYDTAGNITTPLDNLNQIYGIEMAIREIRNLAWVSCCVSGDMVYWENKADNRNKQNSITTYSERLDRRTLERMTTYDLTRTILAEFDNIKKWKPIK